MNTLKAPLLLTLCVLGLAACSTSTAQTSDNGSSETVFRQAQSK